MNKLVIPHEAFVETQLLRYLLAMTMTATKTGYINIPGTDGIGLYRYTCSLPFANL